MNIILLKPEEIQNNIVQLNGRRAEHIAKILRCKCGDTVRVGILGGLLGTGQILEIVRKPYSAIVQITVNTTPPPPPAVDLILALPRPIMLKRILSQATAIGVRHFYIIHSRRVEKSFWESNLLEEKEYTEHLLQGLEQAAVDTRLPTVSFHSRFKPFIEDFFPDKKDTYKRAILAHPPDKKSNTNYSAATLINNAFTSKNEDTQERIVVAIGPEGGWIDYEVEKFCEQGFLCGSMGERILKVDTAVIVLLGLAAVRR